MRVCWINLFKIPFNQVGHCPNSSHATPRHSLHRPMGRPYPRRRRPKGQSLRLRRPGTRLLGRSFRRRPRRRTKKYCDDRHALLARHGLKTWAISAHLVGQAVCDNIDERHKAILPPHVWGNGKPEDVRKRAAEEIIKTAQAAKNLGVKVVNGFTGSKIWQPALQLSAGQRRANRRRLRRFRRAVESHPRRIQKMWSEICPGSASHGDRL